MIWRNEAVTARPNLAVDANATFVVVSAGLGNRPRNDAAGDWSDISKSVRQLRSDVDSTADLRRGRARGDGVHRRLAGQNADWRRMSLHAIVVDHNDLRGDIGFWPDDEIVGREAIRVSQRLTVNELP